jgi:hypothetical protein
MTGLPSLVPGPEDLHVVLPVVQEVECRTGVETRRLEELHRILVVHRQEGAILRRVFPHSLALAIHPRVGVVEGQVNVDDVLNTEVGGVIRMRAPGMVQPFSMPFVGQQAFPMLDYMDAMKESRTGITKAAAGLAADSLQSSTRAAVAATVSASQQRIELIARIFAESGMKRLFTGLLKLAVQNQRAERMVRLRGQFVPVDPRSWDANMDVIINIALGGGTEQEKVSVLTTILAKQEQIFQQAGIDNPLVSLAQYRNTLAQILALSGFKDATQFFSDPAQMPPMPPQQPKPSPEEMLAQAQMAAIQAIGRSAAAALPEQPLAVSRIAVAAPGAWLAGIPLAVVLLRRSRLARLKAAPASPARRADAARRGGRAPPPPRSSARRRPSSGRSLRGGCR